MEDETGIRVHIAMDDGFEPGPRTSAAIAELAAALEDEHGTGDDVVGFGTGRPVHSFTFGFPTGRGTNFHTTAGGDPNVLMDTNPPTERFGTTVGGDPNI